MTGPTIDPEFQALIPPLTAEERDQLEANLRAEGCRDSLVVWNGVLLDGHHRFAIGTTHGIAFTVAEHACADRDEAKAWIIRHQFGRRNLTTFQRAELALALEPLIAAEAHRRKVTHERSPSIEGKHSRHVGETDHHLAQIAGISRPTMARARYVSTHGTEDEKAALRAGKKKIAGVYAVARARSGKPKHVMTKKGGQKHKTTKTADAAQPLATVVEDLKTLVRELRAMRKDNHDAMSRVRWNVFQINARKQTLMLNTVELRLEELINRYGPGQSSREFRHHAEEYVYADASDVDKAD